MLNRISRRGFTLIEMIVFISIVGVLIGLLLPAVGRVRESGQQAACRNNLKQIGLALQAYHHTHKCFPSAFLFVPTNEPPIFQGMKTSPGWGWGTLLLPYLDQAPVYHQINLTKSIEMPEFKTPRTVKMKVYTCPTDRNTGVFWVVDEKIKEEGGLGAPICEVATNSYTANYGTGKELGEHPDDGNGVFFRNSQITIRDIRDGVTNTIAIGERAAAFAQSPWAGAVSCGIIKTGEPDPAVDTLEHYWMEEAPVQVMAGFSLPYCEILNGAKSNAYCFYSPHQNVGNFVFADAAVHAISRKASYEVLKALSTRDGGDVAKHTDY